MLKLSIITPTYNRSLLLNRLIESLKNQTRYDFEWILVDDGSEDDTKKVFDYWVSKNLRFSMRYYFLENSGKHKALNYSIPLAKYDYIFILDSDDLLRKDAVEYILYWIDKTSSIKNLCGVSGLKCYFGTQKIIGKFPKNKDYIDSNNIDRGKNKLAGDKAEIYKKDILLKFPFKEFDHEKFIPESSTFDLIAKEGFKLRWYNKIICECEYLNDGLSNLSYKDKILKNLNGFLYNEKVYFQTRKFPKKYFGVIRLIHIYRREGLDIKDISDYFNFSMFHMKLINFISNILELLPKKLSRKLGL